MQGNWQTATLVFKLYGCSQSSTATACRGNGMKSTRATKVKSLKNWSSEQVCRKSSFWQEAGQTTMKTLCLRRLLHTLQLPVPKKIQKLAPKHDEPSSPWNFPYSSCRLEHRAAKPWTAVGSTKLPVTVWHEALNSPRRRTLHHGSRQPKESPSLLQLLLPDSDDFVGYSASCDFGPRSFRPASNEASGKQWRV